MMNRRLRQGAARRRGRAGKAWPGLEKLESRQLLATGFNFDFGTPGSPVASGYTEVSRSTTYSASRGYGWTSGTVYSWDRGAALGDSLTRDFCFSDDATFVANVPSGTYTVRATLGDVGPYAHGPMTVSLQGADVDAVRTAAGQTVTRTYTAVVTDGRLTLRLRANGPDALIESLVISPGNPPPGPQFDFGTSSSPLAAGYTEVDRTTTYSASRGYGWTSGTVYSWDRGAALGDSLTRDFCFTDDATFVANLPSGTYTVQVTLGDAGPYAHGPMTVSLQGVDVDSVRTAASQTVTRTYNATVTDGRLTLRLRANGPDALIEGLVISPVTNASATTVQSQPVVMSALTYTPVSTYTGADVLTSRSATAKVTVKKR